jgi:hypothetical protein
MNNTNTLLEGDIHNVTQHIMFSYSWDNKDNVRHIYNLLEHEFPNIPLWIDIHKMHGNIMEKMNDAVENSFLIIIFLSKSYKNSKNCKIESDLVINKKKNFLLVLLDTKYPYLENKKDNWLSKTYKNQFYIDLSEGMKLENINKLKQLINNNIIKTYGNNVELKRIPSFTRKRKNSKNNIYNSPILFSNSLQCDNDDNLNNFVLDNNLNQNEINNIKELIVQTPRTMVPMLKAGGMSFKGILEIVKDIKLNDD